MCHVIRRCTIVVPVGPFEEVVLHDGKVSARVVEIELRLGLERGRRLHTFISRATLFKIICYYKEPCRIRISCIYKELSKDNQLNSA